MEFTLVTNLIWCGQEKNSFNCDVSFVELGNVPFCCHKDDLETHSQLIWTQAMAGAYGKIAEPPPETPVVPATATPSSGEVPQTVL